MNRPWTQEEIDTEVATYSDDWEYKPMDIVERLRSFDPMVNVGRNEKEAMRNAADEIERLRSQFANMIANPGNATWVGMKMLDEYCGKPTNYAATTIFRAMVEAYAAEHSIGLSGAVAIEREACAALADDMKSRWVARGGNIADVSADAANQIATDVIGGV